MNQLDEIRERLQAATPGPWKWDGKNGGEGAYMVESADGEPICQVYGNGWCEQRQEEYGEYDHALILNAPTDIAYLLDQLQTTQAEVERLRDMAINRGKRLFQALEDLAGMYNQYTPGHFGHDFMSAGEDAQDALGMEGLLDKDDNAIYPSSDSAPQAIKDLRIVPPAPSSSPQQEKGGEGHA